MSTRNFNYIQNLITQNIKGTGAREETTCNINYVMPIWNTDENVNNYKTKEHVLRGLEL